VTTQRAPIFEEDELDLSDFEAAPPGEGRGFAPPDQVRRVAESAAFRSREPTSFPVYRRYRTGRNVQLNIKVRQDTLDAFNRLCDTHGWVQGETLERAILALERELAADSTPPSRR
jgi:hypothetical protein